MDIFETLILLILRLGELFIAKKNVNLLTPLLSARANTNFKSYIFLLLLIH